jgi:hypothetical protein
MISNSIVTRFQDDNRAVAPLIGFIFLFGFLVIAFVGYQAQVVPQQNAETEFDHFQENRYELIELRNSISRTGTSNRAQFPTVQVGTSYRTRTLALNGPPPAGLLQTSEPYPINISNESGGLIRQIPTRFIQYQPRYYEIYVGSTWYEHSLLYLDDSDRGGGIHVIREQEIVDKGSVNITAVQNSFQKTGTGRVTLEVYPMNNFTTDDFPEENNLTVTIPTRLEADEYWNETLNGTSDTYQGVDDEAHGNNTHALNLTVDSDNLRVNTVGVQTEPDENPITNIDRTGSGIDYKVEAFDTVGDDDWVVPDGVTEVDVLVVGGGGGGAANTDYSSAGGGGGGAGGLVFASDYDVNPGDNIDITVGDGGDGIDQEGTPADNGDNSTFDDLTAIGGGGGILTGGNSNQDTKASDGGSGGGGRQNPPGEGIQPNTNPNPNVKDFGNDGSRNSNDDGGGGGGGAGEEPGDITGNDGAKGGNGLAEVSQDGETYRFADVFGTDYGEQNNGDVYFAGGGGGGGDGQGELGSGGLGGGGDGGSDRDGIEAKDGAENTGGGGGGGTSGSNNAEPGGDGGSGIVIIRWEAQ